MYTSAEDVWCTLAIEFGVGGTEMHNRARSDIVVLGFRMIVLYWPSSESANNMSHMRATVRVSKRCGIPTHTHANRTDTIVFQLKFDSTVIPRG